MKRHISVMEAMGYEGMFQRRHMIAIACALHRVKPRTAHAVDMQAWINCVGSIAAMLAADHDGFQTKKFVDACVGGNKPLSPREQGAKEHESARR